MSSLPLLPDSGPRLVGIARLAAHGESVRQGHEVEYFTLPVRSLLNRCSGTRMPFAWTINPYRCGLSLASRARNRVRRVARSRRIRTRTPR